MSGLLITVAEFRHRTVNDLDGLVSSLKDLTGRGGGKMAAMISGVSPRAFLPIVVTVFVTASSAPNYAPGRDVAVRQGV